MSVDNTSATVANNTTEFYIINPIVRTFLLAVYVPIFTCSSVGLFVLHRYLQKESGPSNPFLKMVVKVTSIGAGLGKGNSRLTLFVLNS